jgi:hypothetical protein
MGNTRKKVVPAFPSLSTLIEPPNLAINVFTHHRPKPRLPLFSGDWVL